MEIRERVSALVCQLANEVGWLQLSAPERQRYYEQWTSDPGIGGQLQNVMPPSRIRVFLKDTVMKSYSRTQRPPLRELLGALSIPVGHVTREFDKPEALLCDGTDLFTAVAAKDWRVGITSAFERAWEISHVRRNIVFIAEHESARFTDHAYRLMIETGATRLGIAVHWIPSDVRTLFCSPPSTSRHKL